MRALVIAYHFPPVGGAGVQRTVKFVRHLPARGWEPVVVTGPLGAIGDSHLVDATLAEELPGDLEVVRVPGPEPQPEGRTRRRLERWARLDSRWAEWWVEGVCAAAATVRDVDVVFATMSPFETAEAASRVAGALGVPWVADLRDPWALDEMFVYPTALHRRLELARMRRLLSTAGAIVANTPDAAAAIRDSLPGLGHIPVRVVTNGWDADDFAPPPPPERDDGVLRIVHTGELHTSLGREHRRTAMARRLLGGSSGGIDILCRSHVHLLEALDRVLTGDPSLEGRIELHLAGNLSAADRDVPRGELVREHGYLPHGESVALLRSADLLFLPMYGLAAGRRARIVPGKTYEYLAAGKPILAAVPEGDVRDILAAAGNALVCDPRDVDAMTEHVRRAVWRFRNGRRIAPPPDREVVARFERRVLADRLGALLHEVAGVRGGEARARLAVVH